jgi:hypothetical protein
MTTETDSRVSQVMSMVDDLFDWQHAKNYQLAISLGADGISAAVWDDAYNKMLAIERFAFRKTVHPDLLAKLSAMVIRQSGILRLPYKKVSLGIVNSKSTLVPNSLFDAGEKEALLKFNHSLEEDEVIAVDHLPNLDAKNIYAFSAALRQQFQEIYPHLTIHHCSSPFIEYFLLRHKRLDSKIALVNLQTTTLEIIVLNAGKLLFYNSFGYQTPEDIIYFLLFVFEQLQLNPETIDVELFGELEKNSPAYQLLYKYIRNLKLGDRPGELDYSIKIAALPKHCYTSLFSQFLF